MADPKPFEPLLLAVAKELARGNPPGIIRERMAKRFGVSTRTVTDYIAAAEEQREEDDRVLAAKYRRTGVFVARAAAAKWVTRADKLYQAGARLLARADRLDGGDTAIGNTLARMILRAGRQLDDGPDDQAAPIEIHDAAAALEIAREDRRQASTLIKRAEGCETRALDWFDRGARIAGAYEPAAATPEATRVQLTSPQRRAKLDRLGALLREAKARGAVQ